MSDFEDVRDLDAVLITHQHPDHVDPARLAALLAANPGATLVVDADTPTRRRPGWPRARGRPARRPADVGGTTVDVLGGIHAAVYGDVPAAPTRRTWSTTAPAAPRRLVLRPGADVDVLAVAIDGPWLKLAEAVDYVRAVGPRVAVPIHEGETTDPAKYAGMLAAFSPEGTVRPLERAFPLSSRRITRHLPGQVSAPGPTEEVVPFRQADLGRRAGRNLEVEPEHASVETPRDDDGAVGAVES